MIGTIESARAREGGGEGGGGPTVIAQALAFDTEEIDLPPGRPSTLTFDNEDAGVLHNIAIYVDDSLSENLFQGEQFAGIDTRDYEIPALEPGTYYFHCDVHPTMAGDVVVGAGPDGRAGRRIAARKRPAPPTVPPAESFAHPLLAWSTWLADAFRRRRPSSSRARDRLHGRRRGRRRGPARRQAMNEPAPALAGETVQGRHGGARRPPRHRGGRELLGDLVRSLSGRAARAGGARRTTTALRGSSSWASTNGTTPPRRGRGSRNSTSRTRASWTSRARGPTTSRSSGCPTPT